MLVTIENAHGGLAMRAERSSEGCCREGVCALKAAEESAGLGEGKGGKREAIG